MNARLSLISVPLACGFLAAYSVRAAEATEPQYTYFEPDAPSVAEISALGESVIADAANAILVEVRHEVASKSAAKAIDVMHIKNYRLPAHVPGKPAVTALRWTSLRVRNPANAPDPAEMAVLKLIQRQLELGDAVDRVIVQKIEVARQPAEWRVYRPLAMSKQCLDCHGTEETLAPGVAASLKAKFPTDEARDYITGQWRGLLRVSIVKQLPKKS
jgi:hypothetical protein